MAPPASVTPSPITLPSRTRTRYPTSMAAAAHILPRTHCLTSMATAKPSLLSTSALRLHFIPTHLEQYWRQRGRRQCTIPLQHRLKIPVARTKPKHSNTAKHSAAALPNIEPLMPILFTQYIWLIHPHRRPSAVSPFNPTCPLHLCLATLFLPHPLHVKLQQVQILPPYLILPPLPPQTLFLTQQPMSLLFHQEHPHMSATYPTPSQLPHLKWPT